MASTYKLWKETQWQEVTWYLAAPGNSIFGRYATKKEAMADARKYGLKVEQE